MKNIRYILLLILGVQLVLFAQKREIVAYYSAEDAHHGYFVKNIKTSGAASKITTLIFAFASPRPDSLGSIVPQINSYIDYQQPYTSEMSIDGVADDSTQPLRGQFNQLKKLKAEYPGLKILLSIGGWGGGKYFSDAVCTPMSREIFVDDCINKFIYGDLPVINGAGGNRSAEGIFDGFDIDWEFPVSGGPEGTHNIPEDKENLTKLLELFRKRLDIVNPKLILTEAVPAFNPNLNNYDIKAEAKYLDWFNLMTYDLHGNWNNASAHHTNLLSSPQDTYDNGAELSFNKSVKYFLDSLGISSQRIVPGAAFYGKSWTVIDTVNNGLYQPAKDTGGVINVLFSSYSNLVKLESEGYNYYWDTLAMAPWLFNPVQKIFWTFDDAKSISLKARYVDAYNLRGLMFWEISGDDSNGTLVNTIFTRNMPPVKMDNGNYDKKDFSIDINQPINNSKINAGSNVIINTIESGKDMISKVEFFVDGKSIGYTTIAPFDWVWFNTQKGKHEIKAMAVDNSGFAKYSKVVIINVN